MKNFSAFLLILTLSLTAAPYALAWEGSETVTDGVQHVMNPHDPINAQQVIPLEELWRTSVEEDDEDAGMGFVTDVQIDSDGNFYLLDSSLNEINVLSSDGELLRQIGREGEGPAEFRNVSDFMIMPDGTFGVLQVMPAKVVTMDRMGIPGGYFSICGGAGGLSLIDRAQSAGGHLVMGLSCANYEVYGVDYSLAFLDSDGEVQQIIRQETEIDPTGNINIGGVHDKEFIRYWTLAPNGLVYVSPYPDQYAIEVYNAQGDLVQVIGRDYKTIKRSKEALAADRKRQEEMNERFGGMVKLATRKVERDIAELHYRANGELWVSSSKGRRDCPEGMIGLFDVFDKAGRFDHTVGLQADYNPKKDDFLIVGDNLFILKQAKVRPASSSSTSSGGISTITFVAGGGSDDDDDEEDMTPPSVVCYQLPS